MAQILHRNVRTILLKEAVNSVLPSSAALVAHEALQVRLYTTDQVGYLAERFHDGKISEKDFRTKLALIGKRAFDEAERCRRAHTER
jgi:hypothetical protein